MSIQCDVTEESKVAKKLTITVPADRISGALDVEFNRLKKSVRVKGFRPGKAPRQLLERHYGDQVRGQVLSSLMSEVLEEVITEQDLAAVGVTDVEPGEYTNGQDFQFTANVEIRPEVEGVVYDGLTVARTESRVDDSDVDEQLERMRESMAQVRTVEGRDEVQAGDILIADLETFLDGEPMSDGKRENLEHQIPDPVGDGVLDQALIGAKIDATIEAEEQIGEDSPREELKGKTLKYKALVKEIRQKVLPELDDELAKDLGQTETLADLKDKIRSDLEMTRDRQAKETMQQQARAQLMEKNELEVPQSMVERRAEEIVQNTAQGLKLQGVDLEQLGLDPQKLLEEARGRAAEEVKTALLLDAVGKAEGIEVSDEEVDSRIEEIATGAKQPVAKVRGELQRDGRLDALRGQLREEKILAFLVDKANIISPEDVPQEDQKAEEEEGEK